MSVCTEDILSLSLPPSMDSRIASDTATQHTTTTTTTQQPFATLSRSTSKAPHSGTESGKRRLLHHCNINSSTISITHTLTRRPDSNSRLQTTDHSWPQNSRQKAEEAKAKAGEAGNGEESPSLLARSLLRRSNSLSRLLIRSPHFPDHSRGRQRQTKRQRVPHHHRSNQLAPRSTRLLLITAFSLSPWSLRRSTVAC